MIGKVPIYPQGFIIIWLMPGGSNIMKKLFTLITAVCMLIIATMTGCTVSTAQTGSIQYDENIIQEAIQRQVDLIPIYTDPSLLPINYQVEHISGRACNVTIGEEVVSVELPPDETDLDSINWKDNPMEVTEGKVWETLKTAKSKVVAYINSSQIIKDKQTCIDKINQTPLYYIDPIDINLLDPNEIMPDAFYKDDAIWVFRNSLDSICEWMFVHEMIHYLREITNNTGKEPVYHGMILDEVITDIICSSLKPKLINGIESGYAQYYDVGYKYLAIWKEAAIEAYFYGYQKLWNITGKDEFDMFVFFYHNMDCNELAHDCTIFTLSKWQSNYMVA